MYRLVIKLLLTNGDVIEGVALDTLRDEHSNECIKIQTTEELLNEPVNKQANKRSSEPSSELSCNLSSGSTSEKVRLIVLDEIVKMTAQDKNPHFNEVAFK